MAISSRLSNTTSSQLTKLLFRRNMSTVSDKLTSDIPAFLTDPNFQQPIFFTQYISLFLLQKSSELIRNQGGPIQNFELCLLIYVNDSNIRSLHCRARVGLFLYKIVYWYHRSCSRSEVRVFRHFEV